MQFYIFSLFQVANFSIFTTIELLNLLLNLCDVKVTILPSQVSENECGLP